MNLLQYVCRIEGKKHIPRKVPAPTYLSAFEYAGTLTCSWKSFVILNHFSSKSLFMSSPKRLRVEGTASRSGAPGKSEEGRTVWALPGALSTPPDQPVLSCIIWHFEKQECKLLKSSQGQMLSWYKAASLPQVQLSYRCLHWLRIWLLLFNLAWISASTNFVFLIHNHRLSPAILFWYLNLFTVPRLLVVMTH